MGIGSYGSQIHKRTLFQSSKHSNSNFSIYHFGFFRSGSGGYRDENENGERVLLLLRFFCSLLLDVRFVRRRVVQDAQKPCLRSCVPGGRGSPKHGRFALSHLALPFEHVDTCRYTGGYIWIQWILMDTSDHLDTKCAHVDRIDYMHPQLHTCIILCMFDHI